MHFVDVVDVSDVDVEVLAGAGDAVAALTSPGVAGVVNAVAAAAVDSSHVSRSRFSQVLLTSACAAGAKTKLKRYQAMGRLRNQWGLLFWSPIRFEVARASVAKLRRSVRLTPTDPNTTGLDALPEKPHAT
jgi:hypothetical protein